MKVSFDRGTSPTRRLYFSIEYWFRCMDQDGDGYISMFDMEYFYEEQTQRMEALGIETLPFEDIVCQVSRHEVDREYTFMSER